MRLLLLGSFIAICLLSGCGGGNKTRNKEKSDDLKSSPIIQLQKPVINVYIENSGSMNGYVNGGSTEFQQALYSYISNIKQSAIFESLNLFYINNRILPQDNNIKNFISNLTPSSFKKKGGDLGSTDMSELFETLLKQTNDTTISVFVSDCIISPGKGVNAEQYLVNQQIGIKNSFVEKIKEQPSLSLIIYRLTSQFSGEYYDKLNNRKNISAQRPYFLCLIGSDKYLKQLTENKETNIDLIKGSRAENYYTLFNTSTDINYAIQRDPKHGTFEFDKENPKNSIINARSEEKGSVNNFMFTIGINYSKTLLDNDYLTDINNYSLSDKNYTIEKITASHNSRFTHLLHVKTDIVKASTLKISLLNNIPTWVNDFNDDEGLNIMTPEIAKKTYGIKYVIGGIYDAFTSGEGNAYEEMTVNINKK